jgi:hypothetical protein
MPFPRPKTGAEETARPSETVAAVISVVLGVYLVGLLLTIVGNTDSGSSAVVRTIKGRLFSPWLVPAWLDLGFDHPFTRGLPEDADHAVEIRRHDAAAGGSAAALRLPAAAGGERAARWRRLARAIATGDNAGDNAAILAAGVGRGAFAGIGAEDVVVRVLRSPLPERSVDAAPGRPEHAYAARVRRVGDEVQLMPIEARGELAPLIQPRGAQP